MKPLKANEIIGNWATVLLRIKSDDSICFESLRTDLEYICSCRVNGIYTNGTAGEFAEQTIDEFKRISEITAEICGGNETPFQLGASHTSANEMLSRIRFAAKSRPSAIQIILPDWFPLNDAEAVEFLKRAADAADGIGLVLYNPPHAKRVLRPHEIGSLKYNVDGLVGVKVKNGDKEWYREMRNFCGDLSVFIPGHNLASGIAEGASGSYSNVACLSPLGAQRWYELIAVDSEKALEIETRINAFLQDAVIPYRTRDGYCNAALDKFIAAVGGWSKAGTRMRFPYRSIPETGVAAARALAQNLIPEILLP